MRYALVPGDMFGLDGMIFGDKRTVSCTTASKHNVLLFSSMLNVCIVREITFGIEEKVV